MKRSKKVLRNHFLRRLKAEREKSQRQLEYERKKLFLLQKELDATYARLNDAKKLNLTLDVENSLLVERIKALKTKKWYQFWAAEPMILKPTIPVTSMISGEGTLLGYVDPSVFNKLEQYIKQ